MFSFLAEKLNVKNLGDILAPSSTPEEQLHAAIEEGMDEKFMRLLDESQLDLKNTLNPAGYLPIHTAAYHGRIRMIECLLDRGVDVNVLGPRGNTTLHVAAAQSREETVKYLINRGANPAIRNNTRQTAYDVAKGDQIRQFLLPLQFRHEDLNEAAAYLPPGITPTTDPMDRKPDLAPPPTDLEYNTNLAQMPNAVPMMPNNMYAAPSHCAIPRNTAKITRTQRPIQADGFGSSVGNEQLTAKFGNVKAVKVTAPPPSNPYEAPSVPIVTSNPYSAQSARSGPKEVAPQFKIFNPKLTQSLGQTSEGGAYVSGSIPAQNVSGQSPSADEEINLTSTARIVQ
uniref:Uncharacterized protein AlNc14C200G8676 n=1 Tax=Albugo laibachii Nc14 TaxID=890382 RepID=F0WQK7_9STRA|nr:conserved hypothetical protein [Albugo laibachii Nc14]CCA24150.1 conserved hypothetical protein [Albugo laibachii Nc14]|eukprot:CCA24150.1 conserved hypothetical protein [Albugo laibachii Nc14]